MKWTVLGALCLSAVFGLATVAAAEDPVRNEVVSFQPGASSASLSGTVTGYETVLYRLGAEAGQRLRISLASKSPSVYFNLYEPGRGMGDEALAMGEQTGPMMPEINQFDGTLALSGDYTLAVFLYRNAAREGKAADYTLDIEISGDTGDVVQGDFADGLAGGPDFWAVNTSGPGGLNLRAEASTGAAVLAQLPNGTVVRNMGCRMAEARRWCQVATLDAGAQQGWAAGDFLIEAAPPEATAAPDSTSTDALVPGTGFHATGQIDCAWASDAKTSCDFGVVREGNGDGSVTVMWKDGITRVIRFKAGTAVGFDMIDGDPVMALSVSRQDDNSMITIGSEHYVIPDAVIFGG